MCADLTPWKCGFFLPFIFFHMATWVSVILSDPVFYFLSSPYHNVYFPVCCPPLSVSEAVWPILMNHAWVPWEWICLGWIQKPACPAGVSPGVCFQPWILMLNGKTFLLGVFLKTTSRGIPPHNPTCCAYQHLLFKLCVFSFQVFSNLL